MSVCEYRDKFTQLSRYAPGEVDNDAKKQERFLEGLNDGLQLQLMTVVYADFQILVDRAIVIENKRWEMEEKKRRIQSQSTGSNTRPVTLPSKSSSRGTKNQLVSMVPARAAISMNFVGNVEIICIVMNNISAASYGADMFVSGACLCCIFYMHRKSMNKKEIK
jgi:hypothetical protein